LLSRWWSHCWCCTSSSTGAQIGRQWR